MRIKHKLVGLEVKESPGKGRGVFATKPFGKGKIVEISPVLLLPDGQSDIAECTALGDYMFSAGATDSVVALGYASLYNHSFEPNCTYAVSKSVIVVTAIDNIAAGDELTIDYGWDDERMKECGIDPEN